MTEETSMWPLGPDRIGWRGQERPCMLGLRPSPRGACLPDPATHGEVGLTAVARLLTQVLKRTIGEFYGAWAR
jgi:hypothetical protein